MLLPPLLHGGLEDVGQFLDGIVMSFLLIARRVQTVSNMLVSKILLRHTRMDLSMSKDATTFSSLSKNVRLYQQMSETIKALLAKCVSMSEMLEGCLQRV